MQRTTTLEKKHIYQWLNTGLKFQVVEIDLRHYYIRYINYKYLPKPNPEILVITRAYVYTQLLDILHLGKGMDLH